MNKYAIEKELNEWDNRVIYDMKFHKENAPYITYLNKLLEDSMGQFSIIAANTEALVYKIGRHFISQGIKNSQITFIDGKIVESYINEEEPEWKKKNRIDDFFEIFGEDCKNKWVIIPFIECEFSIGESFYFISQFRKYKASGIIFSADGENNLTENLSMNMTSNSFCEFPVKKYRRRVRRIKDDIY